jgi:cytoskeletal protein CcmA (bactofilin family)
MDGERVAGRAGVPEGVTIVGEVTAGEDLVVYGKVEGQIVAPDHHITVGRAAALKARVVARTVTLEGQLDGTVVAAERVRVLGSATLRGHVTTPSLLLVDGAMFNGTADPERTEAAMHVARYRQRHGDDPKSGEPGDK